MSIFFRICGLLLLSIPFVPLESLFGDIRGMQGAAPPQVWLLGLFIVLAVSWLVLILIGDERTLAFFSRLGEAVGRISEQRFLKIVLAVLFVELLAISTYAFEHRPLLVDDIVQLFQAKIFALGRITVPAPNLSAFFLVQHFIFDGGRLYAQYPPLHSAVLALGVLVGKAWIVPIILSLGTVVLSYLFVREIFGEQTARWTACLFVLCPFFLFMGASHMNHVSALFFLTLFLFCFARWERTDSQLHLYTAAIALACVCLIRPLSAIAFGLPFFFFALPTVLQRKTWLKYLVAALLFAAVSSIFLAFNYATTGQAFLPGYMKLWGVAHGLGFHQSPWGDAHTPLTGLRNELADLSLLNEYLLDWPLPALLLPGFLLLYGLELSRWEKRLCLTFFAIPVAYFFYWHRDQFLGPRFLYEGLACLLPLIVRLLLEAFERFRDKQFRPLGILQPIRVTSYLAVLLAINVSYELLYGIPQRFEIYRSSLASLKTDAASDAQKQGIDQGLIFVAVSWGSRILAEMRELGVGASLAEQVYRSTDHCLLFELLEQARLEGWPEARVTSEVEQLMDKKLPVMKVRLNDDPTLRLRPNTPLSPGCAAEIRYDQLGFTTYEAHLLANNPLFQAPYVVARDMGKRNQELRKQYPELKAYIYRNRRLTPLS